jgi:hypothetical protein
LAGQTANGMLCCTIILGSQSLGANHECTQFLESFANKQISSSEDRLEETKRKKLALKAHKLVELMMVSGIPTASGYEERIRFSELEIVETGANENGLTINAPSGHFINGWDINVAGVRTTSVKKHLRYHTHAVSAMRLRSTILRRKYSDKAYIMAGVFDPRKASWGRRFLHRPSICRFC